MSPVVAGHLSLFLEAWAWISDSLFLLQTIKGDRLEFKTKTLFMSPRETATMETSFKGETETIMDEEVKDLLPKNALKPCHAKTGFYSRIFCIQKKDGHLHPIINHFMYSQHFCMPTICDVCQLLQAGDWAVCLDLRDARFHIPVYRHPRRFLMFCWRGRDYQFRCQPFGLSTSPQTFTWVMKLGVQSLRTMGIQTVLYLDDILLLVDSESSVTDSTHESVPAAV